jgi:hypothetical protein
VIDRKTVLELSSDTNDRRLTAEELLGLTAQAA